MVRDSMMPEVLGGGWGGVGHSPSHTHTSDRMLRECASARMCECVCVCGREHCVWSVFGVVAAQ